MLAAMTTTDAILVLCSCPDDATAAGLARQLVEERLAACVSRVPLTASTYRWQGRVVEAAEVLLLVKTTAGRQADLIQRLAQLHPYEVPEIVAIGLDAGLPAYLDWLAGETSG
jgi:periplasmic divalent cation tolerance protein